MKPTVHYSKIFVPLKIYSSALVMTVDHPKLTNSGGASLTSAVLRINDDGSFETFNTHYVPVDGYQDL
jgi:hypothetical protein